MGENVEYSTILALKIDKFHSKLFLFDIVDEKYRLIATAESETTASFPFNDIREGIMQSVDRIQQITGRTLVDGDLNLIIPCQPDGSGIDYLAVTYGFINLISTITIGLLESVSLESLNRLISMSHLNHLDQFNSSDPRKIEEILSILANQHPNIVVIAGGTDQGATNSIIKQIDMMRFLIRILPAENKPQILFIGNKQVQQKIVDSNNENLRIDFAPNIRPSIDNENLTPALNKISFLISEFMNQKMGGFQDVSNNCKSPPLPISHATSIMTNFLSRLNHEHDTSILYIDLNREGIIISAGYDGKTAIEVSQFPFDSKNSSQLFEFPVKDIPKWSAVSLTEEDVKFYLWNKSIHPKIVPETEKQLAIEMSFNKIMIARQLNKLFQNWPSIPTNFNQIIVSGELFSNFLSPEDAILTLLDSLQPTGMTKFFLDRHGILPVLGAIAPSNRFLPVQLIESSAIALISQVISIKSNEKLGNPLMRFLIEFENGEKKEIIINKGSLFSIPLNPGQKVKGTILPLGKFEIENLNRDFEKGLILQGGLCGVIIDARGRPVLLPKNDSQRLELLQKWQFDIKT